MCVNLLFYSKGLIFDTKFLTSGSKTNTMILANASNIHEERSSAHAFIVVLKTHALSRKTECLTRESGEADVKLRNIFLLNFCYIPCDCEIIIKISFICFLRVFIPFAYKYRINFVTESSFKSEPDSSDACES